MVLNKEKIAFIHINKTGGSSIETALGRNADSPTHSMLSNLKDIKGMDNYYKFSFVRNPYDKMVSQYFHRSQNMNDKRLNGLSFKDWIKNLDELGFDIKGTGNQVAWLSNQKWKWDIHKKIYTQRPDNIEIGVDFIGFFENLHEDWKLFQKEVGIDFGELPHRRKSEHKPYQEYYDDETRQIVYTRFEDDFKYFDYKF